MSFPYSKARYLNLELGNNAFDFQKRSENNPSPSIRIAPLSKYNSWNAAKSEIKFANYPAFEVYEENQLISKAGLEIFLEFPNPYNPVCPVYVFDNHNHAFFFWHYAKLSGLFSETLTLLHFDQHKDTRIPANFLSFEESLSIDKIDTYTQEILNVGNFITPAIKTGLIKNIEIIDSTDSLKKFSQMASPSNYLLDIDLDFFSPDLDYIDNQLKIDTIKKHLSNAKVVTIATSPFFIDQNLAIKYLHKIMD
jgi:hypothetical protein